MKAAHVQARIDKRGVARCQSTCPGWIIRTKPGKPKLMACAACNALHPSRLQITDKMVRLLRLATDGLAAVARTLRRERMERATTRHASAPDDAFAALCGHDIGRTEGGRRTHVVAFRSDNSNCAECLRLAEMTPAARALEHKLRSEALAKKFKTKREDADKSRIENAFVRELIIAEARVDARVAMDILELVDFDRAKLVAAAMERDVTIAERERANMHLALVDRTLDAAITAYRHANKKSRGHRRWVFRSNVKPTRLGISDVQCRFCKLTLFKEGVIGDNYTSETDGHTVRCALEYLIGNLPSNSDPIDPTPEMESAT